jgi:hypothetical protein
MKGNITARVSVLLVLLLTWFTGASGAKISSISFCEQVGEDGTIPINVTSRFGDDAPSIHAVIDIEGVKKGTVIRGVWISVDAIEAPDYEIDAAEAVAPSADAVIHFALSRPDNGWPKGNYKLDVYIEGEFAVSAPFSVIGAADEKSATSTKSTGQKTEGPAKKAPRTALLGTWQCRMPAGTSILVFESANRLNLDGQPAKYTLVPGALRVQDESGTQDYPYTLQGNVLTIAFSEGYELQFTKVSDKAEYTGEEYSDETDMGTEPEGYGEPQGVGGTPAGGQTDAQAPAGGDQDLMSHFAGTWWNATTNTETNVTLTADGRYFETAASSYSGGSSDQYGNPDMSWGAAGDQTAHGTWTVSGTREQGLLTIFFQNGNQREINYQVHVENGEVYWSEYYFNGVLYGKKTK